MDVRCEKCGTEYEFDENRIGANGVTVKCTACGFVFKVRRARIPPPRATTSIGKGPQGKEWLVRKPDSQMIAFRELTTLQKWIVEGRIGRDDEISKNGETWKRLGNIMELEPFFSVYEKARTLNTLMDQSQIELRGSEVLSAANPIPQPQPTSNPGVPTLPPSYSSSVSLPTAPAHTGSVQALRGTMPVPVASTAPMPRHDSPMLPGNGMGAQAFSPPNARNNAPVSKPNHRPQPAAIPDLSIRIDDDPSDTSKSDIVARFERSQRLKTLGWVALLVVTAALGGAIAVAKYGPEGNPVMGLAVQYGLTAGHPVDDGATRLVEEAEASADLDTLPSLQKAAGLLEKAEQMRHGDPVIAAERARVLVVQAAAYRRWAKDLEVAAAALEKQKADPKPLLAEAEAKKRLAEPLLDVAFTVATSAQSRAPEAQETARALAAYHLLQKDTDDYQRAIVKAKAGMDVGRVDPATLYLEASAALVDPASPDAGGLPEAKGLLEQAVTARPTMNCARVLLARIALAQADPASAKVELDRVLATAPAHEEAKRLLAAAAALDKPTETKAPPPPPPAEHKAPDPDSEPTEHPDTFEWWMARADGLRERDRTKAALNAYGRAAELKPYSAEPHTGKGWCFLDLDRPQLALASFDRAIRANDKYSMAYYGLAESYRAMGETPKAIDAYEEFLARAPSGLDRTTAERTLARLRSEKR